MLIRIKGAKALLLYAIRNSPSLLIDCCNSANPHSLHPIPIEKLVNVYVIEVELLYKLRDTLKAVPYIAKSLDVNLIVITPFKRLINYDNEKENAGIYEHSWQLINKLSEKYDVAIESEVRCSNGAYGLKPENSARPCFGRAKVFCKGAEARRSGSV